jgi:hypothetical protein
MTVTRIPLPEPVCCEQMSVAFDSMMIGVLTLDGRRYYVEYTAPTAKDTILPRALNFCPWCGQRLTPRVELTK